MAMQLSCSRQMVQHLCEADMVRHHQDCVVPTVKYGGGGIMMRGAMSYNGTAFLTKVNGHLNGAGYINVLENSAIPSAHLLGCW